MSSSSTNPKCPRCGGEEFRKYEHHSYIDSEALSEENKNTHIKRLKCLKCNFEFEPSV
jgi:hypothetical protein